MFRITFVFTVVAVLFQLYEACTTHTNCTNGAQACLGPTGQKQCIDCPCNKTSQCELSFDGKVKCDCANSGCYYSGANCQCPPQPMYKDFILLMEEECIGFSDIETDDFISISNVYLTSEAVPSGTSTTLDRDACMRECLSDAHCFIFHWGYLTKACYKFNTTNVYKFKNFIRHIVVRFGRGETLNIRYCNHYYLGKEGELYV